MKRLFLYIGFVLFVFFTSLAQVLLLNSPFAIVQHTPIVLIFYIIILLLSGEIRTLLALPVALIFLEQFTMLPFGYLSIAIFLSLTATTLILKFFITNRSLSALTIITMLALFIYSFCVSFVSAFHSSFTEPGSFIYFFKANTLYFLQNTFSAWVIVLLFYVCITKFSRRWNPRYVKKRATW